MSIYDNNEAVDKLADEMLADIAEQQKLYDTTMLIIDSIQDKTTRIVLQMIMTNFIKRP